MPAAGDAIAQTETHAATSRLPLWRVLLELVLVAGILLAAFNFFFSGIELSDDGMIPTLKPGQRLLVSRTPYLLTTPARGDIVVVRDRIDPSRASAFRVLGLPGDVLNIKGAQVTLNNQPLREPYLPESLDRLSVSATNVGQYRVPEGSYFLMNDNRFNLNDSRSFGMARAGDLIGRAWLAYWPPESIAIIHPEKPTTGTN